MYLSHFNLAEKPFQITTDPKFLWAGEKHQEALAMLQYSVLDSKGFLLLTGDVGTGKTTLINALLRGLDSDIIVATVVDPNLEKLEFFSLLATAFGIKEKFTKKVDFLTSFAQFLNNAHTSNKRVLLIIDEAQKLSTELLEEIRMLSNIERADRKLLNIFFVGQNEFNKTLMDKECRAIRQRITITHQIQPLTQSETTEYINHRLKVAGNEKKIFTRRAIREIYAFSRGYPRLINIICDHALFTGYVKHVKTIAPATIRECSQELTIPGEIRPTQIQRPPSTSRQGNRTLQRAALYACLVIAIAFYGYFLNASGDNDDVGVAKEYSQTFSNSRNLSNESPPAPSSPLEEASPEEGSLGGANKEEEGEPIAGETPAVLDPPHGHAIDPVEDMTDASPQEAPPTVQERGKTVDKQPLFYEDTNPIVSFSYNDSHLLEKAMNTLDKLAARMVENPGMEIIVRGYTDTIGTYPYNKYLAELRANAVKNYLKKKGISALRIQAVGIGEKNPREPNLTAAGRRANRRVEIEVKH
jgi:general secretion pathway protein A